MSARKVNDDAASSSTSCARCRADPAPHLVRSEYLCSDCFTSYIATKVVKRMDNYKVHSAGSQVARILLPLSLGPSSLTVLHMLDRQLIGHLKKSGRVGYELHVLHVKDELPSVEFEPSDTENAPWQQVQALYPRHSFYRRKLSEALDLFSTEELNCMTMSHDSAEEVSPPRSLRKLLSSLPSPTSRSDFLLSLNRRYLAHIAMELSCTSIALGHSSTKLAEVVLAETANGRGAALPLLIGDAAEFEGIRCIYPARELMRSEIDAWVTKVEIPLAAISAKAHHSKVSVREAPISSKNTTIDQLMKEYFAGVEANYPSIVANVVRTTTRLVNPTATDHDLRCQLCALPIREGMAGLSGWGGDQAAVEKLDAGSTTQRDDHSQPHNQPSILCYGCARTLENRNVQKNAHT